MGTPHIDLIDLSHPLTTGMQIYPGDPAVALRPAATIGEDGCNVTQVSMGSHSGTHADAPFHFFADGARIGDLPLDLFAGPAVVIDATGRADREPIDWTALRPYAGRLAPGTIALVRTDWSRHYGTARYLDHPYLTADAARGLVDLGVRTLGVDTLNPDETPDGTHSGGGWPAHRTVLGAGGVIIENLCHLDLVDTSRAWFGAFPLPLHGADGAPVRAVATRRRPDTR